LGSIVTTTAFIQDLGCPIAPLFVEQRQIAGITLFVHTVPYATAILQARKFDPGTTILVHELPEQSSRMIPCNVRKIGSKEIRDEGEYYKVTRCR